MMTDNDSAMNEQEKQLFSCSYEKPQLMELAVPSKVVRGGSNYDLGDKRNFDGEEETTEE